MNDFSIKEVIYKNTLQNRGVKLHSQCIEIATSSFCCTLV